MIKSKPNLYLQQNANNKKAHEILLLTM